MSNLLYSANAIPVTESNLIRVQVWNASDQTGYSIILRWVVELENGSLSQNVETLAVIQSATDQNFQFKLPRGKLLVATLSSFNAILQNGQLYGIISLQNGDVQNGTTTQPLISGYILANAPLSYPLGDVRAINSGLPAERAQQFTDPGAGVELATLFSTSARTKLISGEMRLLTDATAGSRRPVFLLADSSGTFLKVQASGTVSPSSSAFIYFYFGTLPTTIPTDSIYVPLPEMPFSRSFNITTTTINFAAGDEYRDQNYRIQEYVSM